MGWNVCFLFPTPMKSRFYPVPKRLKKQILTERRSIWIGAHVICFSMAQPLLAQTTTYIGNQAATGVAPASPPTLKVEMRDILGEVVGTNAAGINLRNNQAGNVRVETAQTGAVFNIRTTGNNAKGITVMSVGTPTPPSSDPFLGIPIPTSQNVAGGVVTVENSANITTAGNDSQGIHAQSSTSGFPPQVAQQLNDFVTQNRAANFSFAVSGVLNKDNTTGAVGSAVTASRVDQFGDAVTGGGGKITLNANGTYSFDANGEFADVAVGGFVNVRVNYTVTTTKAGGGTQQNPGFLVLKIQKTGATTFGTPSLIGSNFTQFGSSTTVFPNLNTYVSGLLATTASGGAGNSVNVSNNGAIRTTGVDSHGILATSQGSRGGDGSDATLTSSSTQGGDGSTGGTVRVTADGSISTTQDHTVGVLAWSLGGDGGQGGDSGYTRNSKRGGAGASGGNVFVDGGGTITTNGVQSSGIIALSQGGSGGAGGSGSTFNSADDGGNGGQGGNVQVDGTWDITTSGNQAHGIWAKSTGGVAGGGGNGGWTGTSSGGGGVGTAGGNVSVTSGGTIRTGGNDAYGIYAESIGGFGGGGGSGASIFYASGGSGASAGSGGNVIVTNTATGEIITTGARGHGIFAQSVGGGGGSGGGGGALVGLGGSGSTGGNGGTAAVNNQGFISATGENARGIMAQSVGGGGGDGGNSVGLVAVGGGGSGTSDGGAVKVDNTGTITSASSAIFAQSIGGGGGSGGSSTGWFSFGGTAGGGGDGASVLLSSKGNLTTTENNASAIFAQSVGGGGGNGGNSVAVGAVVSVAIGGAAAEGGDGNAVRVGVNTTTGAVDPVTGIINTSGDYSRGIQAQSVGGGGGNGGFAASVSVNPTGASAAVGIGGKGGKGGGAGQVDVYAGDAATRITTDGNDAHGIFAQSVGGGGGSGGFAVSASAGLGISASLAIGGDGAEGGDGGIVNVGSLNNLILGNILTQDTHSYGIFAQSIGGGGGDGGFSFAGTISAGGPGASLSFGGDGAKGGAGKDVNLYSGANVTTRERDSHGIFAQSVGGGGGSGGFSVAGSISAAAVNLSFGGDGGAGGGAGNVILHSSGAQVSTSGDHSYGVFAQSIGGGGGDGGFSVSGGITAAPSVGFSMGGSGASGNHGATVTLINSSNVYTRGEDSHAVFAQSIGGGGGSGGFSVAASISVDPTGSGAGAAINASVGGAGAGGGDGKKVILNTTGTYIETTDARSVGVFAQSVGGGGGDGGFSIAGGISTGPAVSFSMGGSAGSGGNGDVVQLDSSSNVRTGGDKSHGIVAQSIGGGGGSGGFSVAGSISSGNAAVSASIGGSGGDGGTSKEVTVGFNNAITGTILTTGDDAYGVLAQSVGGGGGNGGFSVAGGISSKAAVNFSLGGSGGAGNHGADVVLRSAASIGTTGANSHALFAQSLGGGGGNGGFSVTGGGSSSSAAVGASIGGFGDSGGDGKKVTVNSSGALITTSGTHADGIHAQSIGGGGGDGGFSIAGGISQGTSGNFSIGGFGDSGGSAGFVDVLNSSDILTSGEISHGIFAQSVGGGGGSGGFSIAGTVSAAKGLAFSMGGYGGSGGTGGAVRVDNSGDISTGGEDGLGKGSYGILAQSIGGGGGTGGFSGAFTATLGPDAGNGMSLSIGGNGSEGGISSLVEAYNSGLIETLADDSVGVFAQSVGGGGGNGGFSLAATLAAAQEKAAVSVSIGGQGAGGGDGAAVILNNSNVVQTYGTHSQGLLAQSIGGGGGNGGFSVTANGASGKQAKSLGVSVGGSAGDGGIGGTVTLTDTASIFTHGDDSVAILAQSIGGGGGNGGFSVTGSMAGPEGKTLSVSVGGMGGDGGTGGLVEILGGGDKDIVTRGDRSDGVLAQSIGGGGGNGGFSASVALGVGGSEPAASSTSVAVSVGGFGGAGDVGGDVYVGTSTAAFTGDITTLGKNSSGIFAQSVGGGGGTGGYSLAASVNLAQSAKGPNNNAAISVGGFGGIGNDGGDVYVYHSGTVRTDGDGSHGVEAQSVGGGGGVGGDARAFTAQLGPTPTAEEKKEAASNKSLSLSVGGFGAGGGDGGLVTIDQTGDILTTGGGAYGIFAQSVGGGGGAGGDAYNSYTEALLLKKYDRASFTKNLKIVVGGSGGSSGSGDTVKVNHTGNIVTTGAGSHGIFAQSIGGGGGIGGAGAVGALGSIGVGGGTGSTGNGGDIIINLTGNIDTYEDASDGINAQSVGGGGGRSGNVDRGLKNYLNLGLNFGFSQGTGNGGDGGNITINSTGTITTRGLASNGIFAQSVGGGGGVGGSLGNDLPGLSTVTNFAGSVGGDGSGGIIDINHTGDIFTGGDASDGIWAQSAGGKDVGKTVDVYIKGDIVTKGLESNAIFTQSIGAGGNADLTVEIETGSMIQGGANTGAGVRFMDGKDNLLTNGGTIQTFDLLLGTAVVGGTGNETVDNRGVVNGNVRLGAGTNTFKHKTGALLQSGAVIDLGAGNDFENAGRISAGGVGTLQTTTLTGDVVQTGDAVWDFDIKPDFTSDLFVIDGVANLGSHINRINLNEIGIAGSPGRYTLITADSGLTGTFRFGTFTGGTMPVGYTFTLINSDTSQQLDLAESTGNFYWRGAAGNMWNGAFVDGESNWTRTTSAMDYIYGTPGALVDVFFSSTGAEYRDTILGADFSANSLTFLDPNAVSINGDNTLTLAAAAGQGITVNNGAGEVRITADLALGADQKWTNNNSNHLLIIAGENLGGSGFDLTLDGTGNTLIASIIATGTGSLTKEGDGLVALTGSNTYSGGTTINGGYLEAGHSHSLGTGNVVLNGGVLRTVNDPALAANTPLHLAIGGNYTQEAPTDLQLRIIGPTGVSDRLDVTGVATLGGVLRPDYGALGYNPKPPAGDYTDEFLIVHADGGISGQFDGFNDVHYNPDFLLRWEPVYETNDVYLLWNQHPFTEVPGLSDNQFATADLLNRVTGIIPAMPMPYNDSTGAALIEHPGLRPGITYLNNRSLADLPVDYDLIAPEELTAIFDSGRAFTQLEAANIENRLREIRDGGGSGFSARGLNVQKKPMSFASPMPVSAKGGDVKKDIYASAVDNPWGVFIAGSAESMDIGNDGNSSGFDVETGGITLGIDYRPNDYAAIGFFQQYTNSDADLTNNGSVDMDGIKFGLYGTLHNEAGFYMNGLVAAGLSDYKTHRLGLNGYADGDTDGLDLDAMISGGYTRKVGALSFGPLASLIYSRQQIDKFTETGSMLPLVIDDQSEDSLVSRIGIEASYEWQFGEIFVMPSISLAWQHEFLRDAYDIDSRLAASPQNGFTTSGPEIGRDSLDLRVGLGVQWNKDLSSYISYQCELGRTNYQIHSITLGVQHQF